MNQLAFQTAFLGLLFVSAVNSAVGYSPEQSNAIAEIRDHGGLITVDEKSPGKPVVEVRFGWTTTDEVVGHLKVFPELRSVILGVRFTDAGMKDLKELTQLEMLVLAETEVTDAGIAALKDLTRLRHLELEDTGITDAALVYLKDLVQLRFLSLENTEVGGAAMDNLSGLTHLETLYLSKTLFQNHD
ncbi:MAG: hypothetical protein ABFC96_06805 [Thermoguttaceae bacterium]